MNNPLINALNGVRKVVLLGHLHPDGDCVGTTLALYNYLKKTRPELSVDLYLDHPSEKFAYLASFDKIQTELVPERRYELCITMDCSDKERLGVFIPYFETAKKTLCIDHHRTNPGYAMENVVNGDASSCSEVLFGLLEEEKIDLEAAECLYTGIVHDTGVFKYSNTSRKTMETAGVLMERNLDCARIIDDSFYRKTYTQNRILGKALVDSRILLNGQCVASILTGRDLDTFGADSNDLDGIIDQMRITAGTECAVFIYEKAAGEYKVSMRANSYVDVSMIAAGFGGGGHIRAAGCTLYGTGEEVLEKITGEIAKQLRN